MGRPKDFDTDEVLNKAVDLLWTQGYERTSTRELTEYLGIGMGSFYGTFGSKHDLFVRAIERYRDDNHVYLASLLASEDAPREILERLLSGYLDETLGEALHRGCFITNSTAEAAYHDPDIAKIVADNRDHMIGQLQILIERGQSCGDFDVTKDPRATATVLFTILQGLRVVGKTRPPAELLKALREGVLNAIL